MNKMRLHVVVLLLATLITACAGKITAVDDAPTLTIMTFNVQNLFDTRHDDGKDDFTYLPIAQKDNPVHRARCARIEVRKWRDECAHWDWSERVLKVKLERIAGTILNNQAGQSADILVFQEVENRAVLETLRRDYLAEAGYLPAVLIEGADDRGIDVAFMSKLPLHGEARLHPTKFTHIDEKRAKDTRGILEATFQLPGGGLLTGFAVHFPAPFHPADLRVQSYRFLNSLVTALPDGRSYFAAGDFNTIAREGNIIDTHVDPTWLVAHRIACADCSGTHYYAPNDDWSFLDMIILSKDLAPATGGWELLPERTRVANSYPPQVTKDRTPASFELPEARGVSDHWPLLVELRLRPD